MADNNKAIYGRKVFFLAPSFVLETAVIDRLRAMEYEVYVIPDYKNAHNILQGNSDSICFVCPDSQMSPHAWLAYLRTLAQEEIFSFLDVGIITKGLAKQDEELFQKEFDFEAGFIKMKNMEDVLHEIVKILDTLEAKGMRRYVRANCFDDKTAELFWMEGDRMIKLKMIDISSVGIAAVLPQKSISLLAPNQVVSNAKLMINGKHVDVSFKVFGIKLTGDYFTAVLMFELETPSASISEVRSFVFDTLQNKLIAGLTEFLPDKTDYEKLARLEDQARKSEDKKS